MTHSRVPELHLRPPRPRPAPAGDTELKLTADVSGQHYLGAEPCPQHSVCRVLVPSLRGEARKAPAIARSLDCADATCRLVARDRSCTGARVFCASRSAQGKAHLLAAAAIADA
jgi:hypothetical protein